MEETQVGRIQAGASHALPYIIAFGAQPRRVIPSIQHNCTELQQISKESNTVHFPLATRLITPLNLGFVLHLTHVIPSHSPPHPPMQRKVTAPLENNSLGITGNPHCKVQTLPVHGSDKVCSGRGAFPPPTILHLLSCKSNSNM